LKYEQVTLNTCLSSFSFWRGSSFFLENSRLPLQ